MIEIQSLMITTLYIYLDVTKKGKHKMFTIVCDGESKKNVHPALDKYVTKGTILMADGCGVGMFHHLFNDFV